MLRYCKGCDYLGKNYNIKIYNINESGQSAEVLELEKAEDGTSDDSYYHSDVEHKKVGSNMKTDAHTHRQASPHSKLTKIEKNNYIGRNTSHHRTCRTGDGTKPRTGKRHRTK